MPQELKNLARCCRIEGDGHLHILGVTADSRKVREGWLFAALPGTRTDGVK
ncbi:MAG TPA: hypothetical protein ENJ62_04910, partial [Bryobacterales bacterium]|nr:hypothetical protein [Bryobacterales bacterium]